MGRSIRCRDRLVDSYLLTGASAVEAYEADGFLLLWVNIGGMPNVDGHGHRRVLSCFGGDSLGLSHFGTHTLVRRNLYEEKREVALPPCSPPA